MARTFYNFTIDECFSKIGSQPEGLTPNQAEQKRAEIGSNEIPKNKRSFYEKYIKPSVNMMMVILLIAALIQQYLGDTFGPLLIYVILILNISIAMVQQFRVEKTLEALEKLTKFQARVVRNGSMEMIDADQLVPGDILALQQGDYISADARVFEANDLSVDESILTGEPIAVDKIINPVEQEEIPIQGRTNMIFSSTFITAGNGRALVTATGLETEIGKITKGIALKEHRDIPLQTQMNKLAIRLASLVMTIILILAIVLWQRGSDDVTGDIQWLVGLAVAAIPFNFPIITTIILLAGVLHLANKQAIVKKLNAIETMGRLSIICSDKTGTLTQNQMTVQDIFFNNQGFTVSGLGYEPKGQIQLNGNAINITQFPLLEGLLLNGIINNNSELKTEEVSLRKGTTMVTKVIGMPTEGALLTLAGKAGLDYTRERNNCSTLKEFSFSSDRKRMSKIVQKNDRTLLFTKGAPERLLDLCTTTIVNNQVVSFTAELKNEIYQRLEQKASEGLRNLGFCFREMTGTDATGLKAEEAEQDMIFLGFVSMLDPPREGVRESVQICHDAGIKVAMITGDHPSTAKSIATSLNIYNEGDRIIKGKEIKDLTEDEIEKASVFARVAPEDKLTIVKALQNKGHIVAMTGDGVNDALALENADVGIAMGLAGTDVAKNAADLILTDDAFTTIETALYHGRGLFNNIRSNIAFLLVCNLMELVVLTIVQLFMGDELFTTYQLYLLYATIHFFPPFGLMFDKYDRKLMKDPPKKADEPIINNSYQLMMLLNITGMALVLVTFWLTMDESRRQTICLATLFFMEIWVALEVRSDNRGLFKTQFNLGLSFLLLLVVGCLYLMVSLDIAHTYLGTIALTTSEWGTALLGSLVVPLTSEIYKLFKH